MDDFREWLSDNLRYFELIGAILLVLLLLVFGIRACVKGRGEEPVPAPSTVAGQETGSGGSSQAGSKGSDTNLLKDADSDIVDLISKYYQARNDKDVEAIRELVLDLAVSDEPLIKSSPNIFKVQKVYTKKGMENDDLVVYVSATYRVPDYEVDIPAVSWLYVTKDEDGNWKIDSNASGNSSINSYLETLAKDADVIALTDQVKKAYDDTMAANPDLAASLGAAVSSDSGSSTEEGERMRATADVNVRASASSDGDLLGMVNEGETITKVGQEGAWIQITYKGQTAYVFGQYFESIS